MKGKAASRRIVGRAILCALLFAAIFFGAAQMRAQVPPIVVHPSTLPNGTIGVAYNQTITATGGLGTTYVFSVTAGTLPPGLSLTPPGFTTMATLSGTPTSLGSFSFTITASDDVTSGSQGYTVVISCPSIGILPSSLPGGTQGTPYNQTLTGVGGQSPYTFFLDEVSGPMPPGLTLSSSGVISGTPTVAGSFPILVDVHDSNGCFGTMSYTITIAPLCSPPASPSLGATPAVVNTSQSATLTWNATIASGQGSYTVLLSINGGPFANIGTVASSSASSLTFTYTVSNLPGSYDFKILASANCGSSSFSNVARVTVMAPCPQSPRVTGVVLTPTSVVTGGTFTLTWNPLGGYSGLYGIFKSTDGGKTFGLLTTTTDTTFTGTATDSPGTAVTFEVEAFANCIYPSLSNFVTLTVLSASCTPPGAVSNVQVRSAGVDPPRAPAPTEFIAVSWTPAPSGTPATRFSVRINGDPEVSVQGTSMTLLPRGSKLDPIQAFVKAFACTPEQPSPETASAVVALFLTPPKASFTVSSSPRAGAPVTFTDTSSPQATSWLWVFDDGTTDPRQSPTHVFATGGTHVVDLFASNGAGTSVASQAISIGQSGSELIEVSRVVAIDASDPQRRRARIAVAKGTWLRLQSLDLEQTVVFLRFLDASGEAVAERRLAVEAGGEGNYDLSAYGLSGEWTIELVSGSRYEPTLMVVGRPGARETER